MERKTIFGKAASRFLMLCAENCKDLTYLVSFPYQDQFRPRNFRAGSQLLQRSDELDWNDTLQLVSNSPIGKLQIVTDDDALIGIWHENQHPVLIPAGGAALAEEVARQLNEYFAGSRREFDLPLRFTGTDFQIQVWEYLRSVRFGTTTTYAATAAGIGRPTAVRAVANAISRNPISIVVGCHRIIGTNRKLTGYAGGIDKKRWLLQHEARLTCLALAE
ncbi:methylated-DNA--[protein]-cysteine S-methyltransferase [Arcanobacterium hippocoleae]|uniref:methylated-DNA--[protein]-cysteine S-methyltransferase n=1 Tax=Arcanobacterium hippocoleae TaxID=149017 RepID=UPI00333FF18E